MPDETEAILKFEKFETRIKQIKTDTAKKMDMEKFKEALALYNEIITTINEMKDYLQFDIDNQTELKRIIDFIFEFYCSYPKFKKMLIYHLLKNIPDEKFNLVMDVEPINKLYENSEHIHFKKNIGEKNGSKTDLLDESSFKRFKAHLQNIYDDSDTFEIIETYVSDKEIVAKKKLAIAILRDMTASNSGFVGLATFNRIFNSDYLILHMHFMLNIKQGKSMNSLVNYIQDEMKTLGVKQETVNLFFKKLNIFVNEYMQFISEHFKQFEETSKGSGDSDDTSFFRIEYKSDLKTNNYVREKLVVTNFIK